MHNTVDKIERYFYGIKPGVTLESKKVAGLLPDEVRLVVENIAIKEQILPSEPSIDKETGEIIPERTGAMVDIEKSIAKIIQAKENEKVFLYFNKIPPKHYSQELQEINKVIGYYETGISGTYKRYNNILLASNSINNILLWPGDIFSFNDIVGPRTVERGYQPAPVILSGATSLDYGGGVCQVSSTLYNAVLKSKLEIIERHEHSKPVNYVAKGRDATVSFDNLDFKFKNISNGPIIIKAGVGGGRIWVQLRGRA